MIVPISRPPVSPTHGSRAVGQGFAQDWVHTGTNLGNDRIRIAAADFKPTGADPQTPALQGSL
jgi:hypothetical protein